MQKYKYFIWDFDGVLYDSQSKAVEVHNFICKQNGWDKFLILDNKLYPCVMEAFFKTLNKTDVDWYYEQHRNIMYIKRKESPLFHTIVNFIMDRHPKSIVLTATYEKLVFDVLVEERIPLSTFEDIIGRETVGNKESKICKILHEKNLNRDNILYIGDSPSDAIFCQKVGIRFIGVTYGYYSIMDFSNVKVTEFCNTQDELVETLSKLL